MAVDPYSPCPCGSGEKFKWCCHKVESYAERAQRLMENGQNELALGVLDEGLKKDPGNAWLLGRKTMLQLRANQLDGAKTSLETILRKKPNHLPSLLLLTRIEFEVDGVAAGVAQLQSALSKVAPGQRRALAPLYHAASSFLVEADHPIAALKHLRFGIALAGERIEPAHMRMLRVIQNDSSIAPARKNGDELSPPPDSLQGEARKQFEDALGWARDGLWSAAAAGFSSLTAEPGANPAAERNLGFCRLWLAEDADALAAFRRALPMLGTSEEAVDLEVICQSIEPENSEDLVEHVQLTWPLKDRDALIAALEADPTFLHSDDGPLDPDDPNSPEVTAFAILSRPRITEIPDDVDPSKIPQLEGQILVGKDTAILDAYDDGRLDRLADRFTTVAGPSIPPAHPRTKVIDKVSRQSLGLSLQWQLPEDKDAAKTLKFEMAQERHLMDQVWLNTPLPTLRRRTPLQAAKDGNAEVALRAAVLTFESLFLQRGSTYDFAALRERLHLRPEPSPDPNTVDVKTFQAGRLHLVPVESLPDASLVEFYLRCAELGLKVSVKRAALALAERPSAWGENGVTVFDLFTSLALLSAAERDGAQALEWVKRGRQAEPADPTGVSEASWDMVEVRVKVGHEPPEVWVPEIAVILDRYQGRPEPTQAVLFSLIDMGLVNASPDPDRPGSIAIDPRPLQALLAEYGPRVTTASGRLGVSAAKPEIWTPGAAAAGKPGGIWTPGAQAGAPPDAGKKLIITGQ